MSVLAQLGSTQFEIAPLNAHEFSHDGNADYVEKPVVGRRPPLEFVGEGTDTRTISCRLFPERFGGLSSVEGLQKQRQSGKAVPLMRGDGRALGWYAIESISVKDTYIGPHGVGKVVEVEIDLIRGDAAGGGSIFSIIGGFI